MKKVQTYGYGRAVIPLFLFCILVYCPSTATAVIPNLEIPEASSANATSAAQVTSKASNPDLSNLKITSFEATTSNPAGSLNTAETLKKTSPVNGLSLQNFSNDHAASTIASDKAPSLTKTGNHAAFDSNQKDSAQAGGWEYRIRSMAIMFAVIVIPPACIIALLFCKVKRLNRRAGKHKHSYPHQHSWQG